MDLTLSDFDLDKPINTISEWDSFNNLMLVVEFQDEFNIEFTALEVEDVQTIRQLYTLLEKKINDKELIL